MGRLVRSGAGCGGVSHAASVPPTLWRVRTPREVWAVDVASGEGETGSAFAGARRGAHETRDTFAGGKWPEFACFVRAKVSVVSSRGSDPPALVLSVSGEVVGRCCEVAVAPIGVKKLAQQEWILGETEKKFALQAKKR